MTAAGPAVLLLTSASAPPAGVEALRTALAEHGPVAVPRWGVDPAAADPLAGPAATVRAGLDAAAPVVVCGVGAGALLGLRLAAVAPDRVAGLVLATGRAPSGRRLVRSVHRGVADLLPVPVLQRLHADERGLLRTLDLVRPRDARADAARVRVPARVAWGRHDPLDRLTAHRLAAALPAGALVAVDAGPGWVWREPERLAAVVADEPAAG